MAVKTTIDTKQMLDIFSSETCYCGKKKASRMSHCRGCYYKLPPEKRRALYNRFFEGYEEAYIDSLQFLGHEVSDA